MNDPVAVAISVADARRGEFEVEALAVALAVRERPSVNVFHRASAIKVDLFESAIGPHGPQG